MDRSVHSSSSSSDRAADLVYSFQQSSTPSQQQNSWIGSGSTASASSILSTPSVTTMTSRE